MKVFTKWFFTFALLCIAGVLNATEYEIDQKFTSIAALEGQSFAIVNETDGKAFFGTDAQNLGYDTYDKAFLNTNSGYLFKTEASAVEGGYLLRLQTPAGEPYTFSAWGGEHVGYLNSQAATGNCCFLLGLSDKNGQDIENGAVWELQYVEGSGFALLNKGTGKYLKTNDAAKYDEPTYFTLCTLKEKAVVPVTATFDFNASNHAVSSNSSTEGDITANEVIVVDGVSLTITPNPSGTTNRYWSTNNGPQLRMYGGTLTIVAPEGLAITNVEIKNGKWNNANTFNGVAATTGAWEGNSTNVIVGIAGNTQMNKIIVTTAAKDDATTTYEIPTIANTAETAYTVAEAIEKIEAGVALSDVVFVKGIVSQVDEFKDGAITYWISDDGTTTNQFECFKGKGLNGAAFAAAEDIEVGARVIVTGTMKKYTPATGDPIYEFNSGNTLVSYSAPFVAPIAEGKYYIFNVAANGFILGANSWGTQASISKIGGIEVEAVLADGKYELKTASLYPGKHLGFNGYVDNGDPANWIIAPVEGQEGVFTLSTNGTDVLFWEGGEATTTTVGAMPETAANAYWKFITPEERMALFESASKENPVDATFLINNPDFGRNTSKAAWQGDDFGIGGGNHVNNNAEKWGGNSQTFDIHQTIELPNGLYKLIWNGFYRYNNTEDNTNDIAVAAHADGSEVINSFIYTNKDSVALTSIADEAAVEAFGKMPFSQAEAADAFGRGLYEQSSEVTIEDGKLIIGIKKINHLGVDWTVWDNFRLFYLGVPAVVNDDDPEITVPEGKTNLIVNGNLASDDVTSFVAKEAPSNETTGATIVAGAGKNNSRGIVVKSADRTVTGQDDEGKDVWSGADWDTQFWINLSEALPAGSKLHVEFDYAANKAASAGTQAHGNPGDYQHWAGIGDVNFTTEWQHFSTEVEVSADMATGNGGKGLKSIAFNLAVEKSATEYYFDNFGVWAEIPEPVKEWENIIVNSDMEGESFECFYLTEQGIGGPFVAKPTNGIGKDGSKAVKVESADGPTNTWDTQFFVRLPYQLPAGTAYKVSFDYKAASAAKATTQAHANPGDYIHYVGIGDVNFTTDWQTYEVESIISGDQSKDDKPMQSIAFNLAEVATANTYIFDNVKFFVPKDVISTLTKNPATNPQEYPGDPNGIETVKSEKNAEGIFNLNGQKVMKAQKGLYIINGKKVVK